MPMRFAVSCMPLMMGLVLYFAISQLLNKRLGNLRPGANAVHIRFGNANPCKQLFLVGHTLIKYEQVYCASAANHVFKPFVIC